MRKVILVVLVVLTILMVGFWGIGAAADESYKGQLEERFIVSENGAWYIFEHFIELQKERREITKIEVLSSDSLGPVLWKEYTDMEGFLVFERIQVNPNKSFTLLMKESSFGMTGTWKYDFIPDGAQVTIRITEDSKVEDPFVRSALMLAGRDANLKQEMATIRTILSH